MNEDTARAVLAHAIEYHATVKRAIQTHDRRDNAAHYALQLELSRAKKHIRNAENQLRQTLAETEVNDHED